MSPTDSLDSWTTTGTITRTISRRSSFKSDPDISTVSRSSTPDNIPRSLTSDELHIDELVLSHVASYFSKRLHGIPEGVLPEDVLKIGATEESDRLWSNAENVIYFCKIKDSMPTAKKRIFATYEEIVNLDLVTWTIKSEPLDLLRRVFTTLSPVNTRARPPVRKHILTLLANKAGSFLGLHPLSVIFAALLSDGDRAELSFRALSVMSDLSSQYLGDCHPMTFKLTDSIIKSARRGGDLNGAKDLAESAFERAQQSCGLYADETRHAAAELAHVLTAAGEHQRARFLRSRVLQLDPQDVSPESRAARFRRDSLALHTMEDLAEFYINAGTLSEGALWLTRAENLGRDTWGPSASLQHVSDKLDQLLKRCEGRLFMDWEFV